MKPEVAEAFLQFGSKCDLTRVTTTLSEVTECVIPFKHAGGLGEVQVSSKHSHGDLN